MTLDQFLYVCRKFNDSKVEYVVVGGFAVILQGLERKTRDVDFIVESSEENMKRIKKALKENMHEIGELKPDDLKRYQTVKLAGKILGKEAEIDLIRDIWGIGYDKASIGSQTKEISGIKVKVVRKRIRMDRHRYANRNEEGISTSTR